MSKIRAALKAQIQEKNRPFISIKGLIEVITNNDECTFIEAANILGYIIEKNIKSIESLYYVRYTNNNEDLIYIKFSEHYQAAHNYKLPQYSHFGFLARLLSEETFNDYTDIFLKDYGVERREFSELLAEEGIFIDLGAGIESQPIPTVSIVDPLPPHEPIKTAAMGGVTDRVRGKAAGNLRIEKSEEIRHLAEWSHTVAACLPFSELSPTALPLVDLGALVEPAPAQPEWSVKTSIERAPGYRSQLFQVLKAAYIAGKPCPKARDVLDTWKANPPIDLQVMPEGVKYNDGLGNPKEADLKAIGQAIKNLMNRAPPKRRIDRTSAE